MEIWIDGNFRASVKKCGQNCPVAALSKCPTKLYQLEAKLSKRPTSAARLMLQGEVIPVLACNFPFKFGMNATYDGMTLMLVGVKFLMMQAVKFLHLPGSGSILDCFKSHWSSVIFFSGLWRVHLQITFLTLKTSRSRADCQACSAMQSRRVQLQLLMLWTSQTT